MEADGESVEMLPCADWFHSSFQPASQRALHMWLPYYKCGWNEAWEESKDPANLSGPYTNVAEMFRDIHRRNAEEAAGTAAPTA